MTEPKKETRNTKQRNLLIACMKENSNRHITAEELYGLLKEKDSRIGIATVYRNLKMLEADGLIEKLYVFDGVAPCYKMLHNSCEHAHHHLICKSCHEIIDFEDDLLETIEKIIELTKGFTITDHRLVFYGICKDCKEKLKHQSDDAE